METCLGFRASYLEFSPLMMYTSSIHEDLLIYFREFVAFRTVAGHETAKQECLDWMIGSFLQKTPHPLHRGDINGAPYMVIQHPQPKLIWFAHFDVVPADETLFAIRTDGDKAFGRGVKDMKGAALPFLMAYRDLCAEGIDIPVRVLLTSDEEVGGRSIPALLDQKLLHGPIAFTPDTGANPAIVVEHKGAVWARLTAHGKGSHGAWPWEGQNPILILAEAITRISREFPPGTQEEWHMTVCPTELRGSDAKNMIPDHASCMLDIRFPPSICKTKEEALATVQKLLPSGCTLESTVVAEPLLTDAKHPMVQLYKKIAEEVIGRTLETGREHGASDARFFEERGIPAFLFGPDGGNLHHRDEWVSVPSILHQYEISARL